MNAQARDALLKIVGKYGAAIASNPQQLRGLLRDFCPDCTREIRWLVTAVEEGVPQALTNGAGPVLAAEVRVQQQTRRFADATGFGDNVARWAVASWALALGVIRSGEPASAESAVAAAGNGQVSTLSVSAGPLSVPEGFKAARGATPEPYTNTGWAKEIIHGQTGIEMVYVPAGTFMMGSPESELGRGDNERLHRVTLTKGFFLGKYPVTQEQWKNVMGRNPSHFKKSGKNAPVEQVSWDDCQEFCRKLGDGFRLPTEAEWEYACRAGTTGPYAGNLSEMGWYGENSGCKTHPVGRKNANAWGLYDMRGNVWEWCQDWYGKYKKGSLTDPAGPGSGSLRVVRGGGWRLNGFDCAAADRTFYGPADRSHRLGFRVSLPAGQ